MITRGQGRHSHERHRNSWFRRSVRYEWRRAVSLRSTWVLLAVSGAAGLNVALNASISTGAPTPDDGLAALTAAVPTVFIASSIFGAFSTGHEYRHNLFLPSFMVFTPRWHAAAGKAVGGAVFAACAQACALLIGTLTTAALGHWAVLHAIVNSPRWELSLLWLTVRAVGVSAGHAALGLSCGYLTGSLTTAVVLPLIAGSVAEPLISTSLGLAGSSRYFLVFADARAAATGGHQLALASGALALDPWLESGTFLAVVSVIFGVAAVRLRSVSLVPR